MQLLIEVQPQPEDPESEVLEESVLLLQEAMVDGQEVDLRCDTEGVRLIVHNLQVHR